MHLKKITTLVFATLCVFACQKKAENTHATLEKITESVYASGTIKSKNQYQVSSTVGGLIEKIWVKTGDLVKKGDPIFSIQNQATQLQAENAALATDFANQNASGDRLDELFVNIETARQKMMLDSSQLARQRGLWAQKIGSRVEFETRELAFQNSKNNYLAAISRYQDLKKQLNFAVAQSKKLLSISKNAAQDFTVRAKMDGRVFSFSKELGEIVNALAPVAVIGSADDFLAELQIDENDIVRIKIGQRVLLTLDSYKGEVFEATVSKIDPLMNERSRTFTIEAVFTKKPSVLYPNLTCEANIVILEKEKAMTIPRSFLVQDSFILLENKEKRAVKIGLKDYEKVEILSGLGETEIILKPTK